MRQQSSFDRIDRPDLNPFEFLSEMRFAFGLYVVLVMAGSMYFYASLWSAENPYSPDELRANQDCTNEWLAVAKDFDLFAPEHERKNKLTDLASKGAACWPDELYRQSSAPWMLGGAALVLFTACIFFLLHPAILVRRRNLSPLTQTTLPEVTQRLQTLSMEAELSPSPEFVWNPLDTACRGQAFGTRRKRYVAVSGGLIMLYYRDTPAFDAVIRHELAHIKNRDVSITYFAESLWWAILILVIIPGIIVFALRFDPSEAFRYGWRMAALIGLAYLARNALLRGRELYADIRASTWDGDDGALTRLLRSTGSQSDPKTKWSLIHTHPPVSERLEVLRDTRRLFVACPWTGFAIGLTVAALIPILHSTFTLAFPNPGFVPGGPAGLSAMVSFVLPVLPAVALALGAIAQLLCREAFASVIQNSKRAKHGIFGMCLGMGVIIGTVISFSFTPPWLDDSFSLIRVSQPVSSIIVLSGYLLLWGLALSLLSKWVFTSVRMWLPIVLQFKSPILVYGIAMTGVAIVLAIWFVGLFGALGMLRFLNPFAADPLSSLVVLGALAVLIFVPIFQPLSLLVVGCLIAYPLAAHVCRRFVRSESENQWVLLGKSLDISSVISPAGPAPTTTRH